ncbi:MAG: chloride channel protein [Phycisphaerae bacterium]|nr:MAG: VWA domain-containing protein [Planctomycetia bacterium]RIK68432.1 MAG: hypothetical protein DCC66_10245 [Planctomycetota bacterium]GJQ27872.1 MAG: chloride channel protein [Phycisphaerae bacterium]
MEYRFSLDQPAFLLLLLSLLTIPYFSFRSLASLGRLRRAMVWTARCLTLGLLIFALAGIESVRRVDDQTAVFVLDTSNSVPSRLQQAAFDFLQRAVGGMRPGKDRVAVLGFDGQVSIEQPPRSTLEIDRAPAAAKPDRTDLARALRMASALMPPDTAKRVVILSDGNETTPGGMYEALTLNANGVPVDVVPILHERRREVVMDRMVAPNRARQNDTVSISVLLRADGPVTGRLALSYNDRFVDLDPQSAGLEMPVRLKEGLNRFSFPIPLTRPGAHRFRATFTPDDPSMDAVAENNMADACTVVAAKDRILYVKDASLNRAGEDASAELLVEALRREQLECDVLEIGDAVLDLPTLMNYSLIILQNISASYLSSDAQASIVAYVQDAGGGLIVIGGDQSFTVGGYENTLLERILPVETSRQKLQLMSTALVLVIDRSGSMQGQKLALAQKSAIASMELLSSLDWIGVLSFDFVATWDVPMTKCSHRADIRRRIGSIAVGGGTDLYPALKQAHAALKGIDAGVRHIIALTDGQSVPGDFDNAANAIRRDGITISTVAVGDDADRALLARIAKIGGGRTYLADTPDAVPRIFVRETMLAGRSGIYQKSFSPQLTPTLNDEITRGLSGPSLPRLGAYVITALKRDAHAPIVNPTTENSDPILAYWQVGLGRVLAFTSGMWPQWGPEWPNWTGFGKLWSQAARWTARRETAADMELSTTVEGESFVLRVDMGSDAPGKSLQNQIVGRVIDPAYQGAPIRLDQTGAGQYVARIPISQAGNYVVRLVGQSGSADTVTPQEAVAVLNAPYSPEFRELRSNEQLLKEIAHATGGRVLTHEKPDAVFDAASIRRLNVHRPLRNAFLIFAIAVFLIDVAVRRLAITPQDAAAYMRRFVASLTPGGHTAKVETVLSNLKNVRTRSRNSLARESELPTASDSAPPRPSFTVSPNRPNPSAGQAAPPSASTNIAETLTGKTADANSVPKPSSGPAADSPSESTTARLLKSRRQRQDPL